MKWTAKLPNFLPNFRLCSILEQTYSEEIVDCECIKASLATDVHQSKEILQ